ncbi:MAG: hypothetical protein U5J99_06915 [Parvularculaceae bacterium]|nr:hypothetical protein [Parvularculaceae bacterium]
MIVAGAPARANQCASPAAQGSGTISGVVNTYFPATSNLGTGGTSITLGAATGASASIASGDLVLIIQMQDAQFDRNNDQGYGDNVNGDPDNGVTNLRNSGRFAFARATSAVALSGGTLTIAASTGIAFTNAAASGTNGQRRYQVIRVPQYDDATIAGTVTAPAWNGTTGGVVVLDVASALTMSGGTISVDGLGFRGGGGRTLGGAAGFANTDRRTLASSATNAAKGEGIAGTPRYLLNGSSLLDTGVEGYPNGSNARGAPGNAGGGGTDGNPGSNDQNTGGGGGAGFGGGGRGGHAWCPTAPTGCTQSGGWGGAGVVSQNETRIIMGGGGGAGTTNNGTGTPGSGLASSGAAGGGIIIIRAGIITGSGTLTADGADANSTVGNDSNGGGGAGGAILVTTTDTPTAALSLRARGGDGGSNDTGGTLAHGPGGGGGGGFVSTSWSAAADVSAGLAGTTIGGGAFGAAYGAAGGASGSSASASGASVPGLSSGAECSPVVTKSFAPSTISSGGLSRMTLTIRNRNPANALAALALTDLYPSGLVNRTPANLSNACGGSVVALPAASSLSLAGGSLAAASNCAIGIDVTSSTAGSYANTVAAGGSTATISGRPVANRDAATSTLVVTGAMSAGKTATVISDPVNGTTNPFAIPGATIEYLISFTNPGPGSIDAGTIVIVDAIPANTDFVNVTIGGPGSGAVAFVDSSPASGLSLTAAGVAYSNDNGATYAYTPVAGADAAVTNLRVTLSGAMAAGRTASIRFRAAVE